MKVLRSTLVIATAAIVAACGDKVTVAGPSTSAAGVQSVSVSPSAVTLAVGQTVNFTAVVNADAGVATTVTWSSSDNSKVSVSATGTASGVAATPGVAICATSTVDTNKKGCAQAVVSAGSATVNPTVSIAAVNFTNGAGIQQPAPVPPGAVGTAVGIGPQLNVVMNVNAGTASLDSLVLKVGGKVAYKQAFTASEAAALLNESNDVAGQAGGITITGSFNTADYCASTNANNVTCTAANQGQATWQNGNQTFQANIYGKQSVTAGGAPSNVQGQSPVATYRFANLDGFHVTMTPGAGANTPADNLVTATDPAGFKWYKGRLDISALFVAYTPALGPVTSVLSTTATFGGSGCSPTAAIIQLTNTSTTSSAGPWTGSFTMSTATGATAAQSLLNGYEWRPNPAQNVLGGCGGLAFTAGGEIVNMAAVGSDGNAVALVGGTTYGGTIGLIGNGVLNTFATSNNPDPAIVFRIDNVSPPTPVVQLSALVTPFAPAPTTCPMNTALTDLGSRTNCWVNDAVQLAGLGTGTGNQWASFPTASKSASALILGGADLGSGRVIAGVTTAMATTFAARAAATGTANATIDAGTAITNATSLAETAINNAYQLRINSTDLMGNFRNSGTQPATFPTNSQTGAAGAAAPGAGNPWNFGVDRTPPVLAFGAGRPNGARIFATPPATVVPVTQDAAPILLSLLASDNSATPGVGIGSLFFTASGAPMTVSQRATNKDGVVFWCIPTATYQSSGAACANTAPAGTPSNGWAANTTNFLSNFSISTDNHGGVGVGVVSAGPDAYYQASATTIDQAGNVSPTFVHLMVEDGTNAAWGGLSYVPAIIQPGTNLAFNSSVGDNVDVQAVRLSLGYGVNGGATLFTAPPIDAVTGAAWAGMTTPAGGATFWQAYSATQFDLPINPCPTPTQVAATCTTMPASLVTQTTVPFPVNNAITNIEVTAAGAGGVGPFVYNVGNNLMTASGFAFNQAVNLAVNPTIPAIVPAMQTTIGISLGAVSPAIGPINNGGGNTATTGGPARWVICAVSATGSCSIPGFPLTDPPSVAVGSPLNSGPVAGTWSISRTGAGGLPTSVSITAVAEGLSALVTGAGTIFANPYTSVQFYAYDPTAGLANEGWRLIANVPAGLAQTGDNLAVAPSVPNGRNWYFTANWTPSITTAPDNGVYRIMAVGITNQSHTAGPPSQRGVSLAAPLAWTTITIAP